MRGASIQEQESILLRFGQMLKDSSLQGLPPRGMKMAQGSGGPELRFYVNWPLRGYPAREDYLVVFEEGQLRRLVGGASLKLGASPEEALEFVRSNFDNPFEEVVFFDKWAGQPYAVVERPEDGSFQGVVAWSPKSCRYSGAFFPEQKAARVDVESFLRECFGSPCAQ